MDASGEKPLTVRRGRVNQVDLYEIKDNELDLLEKGPPTSVCLSFGIFSISIAFSSTLALLTASFKYDLVKTFFVVFVVVGFLCGSLLLIVWYRGRTSVSKTIKCIRNRIPPEPAISSTEEVLNNTAEPPQNLKPKG